MTPPHTAVSCAKPPSGPATGSSVMLISLGDRDPKTVVYNDGLRIWGNCKAVRWEGMRREKEGERRKQNKLVKPRIQDEPPAKIPRHSNKTSCKEQQLANPPCARRIHPR